MFQFFLFKSDDAETWQEYTMGGVHFGPPPNLAISNQMTMKLFKDILWVEVFTK